MEESDLTKLRSKCLISLYGATKNISTYFPEPDDRKEQFDKLRQLTMGYCRMDQLEDVNRKTISSYENAEEIPKWRVMKSEYLNTVAAAAKKKSKFDKHPYMKKFEEAMKNQEEFLPEEEENQEMMEDIAITETVNTYIDPVTKRPITNPVKNKICGHLYDSETASSIINNVKNKGCPCFGCVNKQCMRAEHLELDQDVLDEIQTRRASDVFDDEE